ncbi:hypothetical protein AB6A40_008523 [Gnathostoma spinigerum]|uniref:Uncharacterized protein n=1 Tax=Gnathostoma spinigerum TaxID=75299 RepID=A0ABD6EX27_9BILA
MNSTSKLVHSSGNSVAASLFIHLHGILRELDFKSAPAEELMLKNPKILDDQLHLGSKFMHALLEWALNTKGEVFIFDTSVEQDVRNLIVKHTKWIIAFVRVCLKRLPVDLTEKELRYALEYLFIRFQGMDEEFDEHLFKIAYSPEVAELRRRVRDVRFSSRRFSSPV